jgi:predicted DCC family thiol-disulfide oxidoreductase YuxK
MDNGRHLVLYDGECGLCSATVRTILARDRRAIFHFAALQSDVARALLKPWGRTPDNPDTLYVMVDYKEAASPPLSRGRAALFVLTTLGWPWNVAALLKVLPNTVLDMLYDIVARNRHRVLGRDRCELAQPEHRARFIDGLDDRPS